MFNNAKEVKPPLKCVVDNLLVERPMVASEQCVREKECTYSRPEEQEERSSQPGQSSECTGSDTPLRRPVGFPSTVLHTVSGESAEYDTRAVGW